MSDHLIQLDDLQIDLEKQLVTRAQQTVALPKLSYQLLIFFIQNPSKTNSIDDIADQVWQGREVSNETVIQRIRLLRQGLSDDPKSPRYIKSVRGFGYQLIPTPNQPHVDSGPQNNNPYSPTLSIRMQVFALLAIIVVIGTLVSFKMLVSQNAGDSDFRPIKEKSKASSTKTNRSAILARADYYFRIGQQDDLRRAEEFYRKALSEPESKTRATLGLANTLSALVCRYSQSLELAKESNHLVEQLLTNPTLNQQTRADVWAAKGYAVDCLGNLKLALQSYQKAVELNPKDFSSRSSAAHLLEKSGQIIKAIEWNLDVIEQVGESPLTQLQLARNLELLGFVEKARRIYQTNFELYPDNVFINEAYPQFIFARGGLVLAEDVALKAIERGIFRRDIYRLLGEIALLNQNRNHAIKWFEQSKAANLNSSYNHTVHEIYTDTLTKESAQKRIETINNAITEGDTWPDNFLELFMMYQYILNDQAKAMASLERLVDNGFLDIDYLKRSPFFDELRGHQPFIQLLEKLKQKRHSLKQQLFQQPWFTEDILE